VGAQDQNTIERVPLTEMLRLIARRFQPAAEAKGLYLMVGGDELAMPQTDRQKLDRIVSNLVDNAIKYTQRGGVSLEVMGETDAKPIAIRIADSGIGIPPEAAPYLFDEFYQVSNHERDRSKGFGMGLAICKSLADQLSADVYLARTDRDGSCFEITLPAVVPVREAADRAGDLGDPRELVPDAEARIGADRGGRPAGEAGDRSYPAPTGLCSV
jgi:signal transduction histidine kinase